MSMLGYLLHSIMFLKRGVFKMVCPVRRDTERETLDGYSKKEHSRRYNLKENENFYDHQSIYYKNIFDNS